MLFDMENNQEIKLPFHKPCKIHFYKNNYFQFITDGLLWTYTIKNKNNEWTCESIYLIPGDQDNIEKGTFLTTFANVGNDGKIYLVCDNHFYGWNTLTERSFRIFDFIRRKKPKVIKHIKNYLFMKVYSSFSFSLSKIISMPFLKVI